MPTLLGNTIIIGKVTIEAVAQDETGIDRVEFYIDNELQSVDYEEPYECPLDKTIFFSHNLKVMAYDNDGKDSSKEMKIMIFNISIYLAF
jgi:hypothetical protein